MKRVLLSAVTVLMLSGCASWTENVPAESPDGKPMICKVHANSDGQRSRIDKCVYGVLP